VLNRKRRGVSGFSLIELLIVVAIILIILAMSLPKLHAARTYVSETAAIKAVTTIHVAQAQYYSRFGRYATSLAELGPGKTASTANLISGDLALGEKSGYRYELQVTPVGYTIHANPVAFNDTGSRTFFSDQTLTIRQNYSAEPADAESPEIE